MNIILRNTIVTLLAIFQLEIPLAHTFSITCSSLDLAGDWIAAKHNLRDPECCVVSVQGMDKHLRVLQNHFADNGPLDLDLRARVHVKSSLYEDCLSIRRSVIQMEGDNDDEEKSTEITSRNMKKYDPCTEALAELAKGVASLADGSLDGVCEGVFIRLVCASKYKAHDPMYHTDKAPLRGYVTLRGVGTEYMKETCSPIEYMSLRAGGGGGVPSRSVAEAKELEFIVMKGDHYDYYEDTSSKISKLNPSFVKKIWKRASACVHRSPPGQQGRDRRVIVSLDLADGDDDREWYEADKKRSWRSGMTQRKSHLVA